MVKNVPILLLAAGGSSRMGYPKQLLPWGNQTLIEYQIQKLLKTGNPLIVVLGANSDLIVPVIKKTDAKIVINQHWETGMGSSVSAGIHQVTKYFPLAEGVLITLLDQPLITVEYLQKMLYLFQAGARQIIASQSDTGWQGVPALFDNVYFGELKRLTSSEGARKIIRLNSNSMKYIECSDLLEDMDTMENYRELLQKSTKGT